MAKWLFMLSKRLYKKITFLIILLLIPAVVLGLDIIAKEKNGFINVALAQKDSNDKISNEIISTLLRDEKLICFEYYDSPQKAINAVETGECNSAWVFLEDMENKIDFFTKTQDEDDYFVEVFEPKQNIAMRLSHEKLSSAVYKHCSRSLYIQYIDENFPSLKDVSEKDLFENYTAFSGENSLFEFAYPDSNISTDSRSDADYLVAPVRGLLSILVVLCGMSSAMYYMQDEKSGTFSLLAVNKKPLIEIISQIIAVTAVSVVMMFSLIGIGLSVSFVREMFVTMLYIFAVSLFSVFLRQIIRKINIFASLIPLFAVIMIAVCPVFFQFQITKPLQALLPPTYYINAVNNDYYFILLIIYIFVLAILNGLLYFKTMKFEN